MATKPGPQEYLRTRSEEVVDVAAASPLTGVAPDTAEVDLVIGGMTCAACSARVQALFRPPSPHPAANGRPAPARGRGEMTFGSCSGWRIAAAAITSVTSCHRRIRREEIR